MNFIQNCGVVLKIGLLTPPPTFVTAGEDVCGELAQRVLKIARRLVQIGRFSWRRCGGGCGCRWRLRPRNGTELQLNEHHVIAQSHREVERRLAAEELIHLRVVERLQRLHDTNLRTLRLHTGK